MRDAGPQAADEETGLSSYLSMTRLLVGWACLALGVLNLAMGVTGATGGIDVPYLIFHLVVAAAGIILLGAGVLRRRPGPAAWLTGTLITLAGLLISALPHTSAAVCCRSDYDTRHGFPFTLLAEKDDHWRLDTGHALVDLLFWACIGIFALLAVMVATPATPARESEPAPSSAPPRHAEPRPETVDDENVRGLP
ncbi:hypothetical protein [Paractinoplanes durhamensis]|uniref:Uncharacterized protein n=1 Tax=Paractinoplanes durhamensis TaxID=113563 RepID=A0ABQ3YPG5_9ACTN|nr:hypothetical protein [Actinoplanes durhamensis]GID99441.1 hypothetical protein Adu01nite_07920 [Actinoplanes durhamensis]